MLIAPGTGICYDRTAKQSYYCADTEFDHDFLLFDAESAAEEMLIREIPKNMPFLHPFPHAISSAIQEIENEKRNPSRYRAKLLSCLCSSFVYRLLNDTGFVASSKKATDNYDKFSQLRTEVYQHPRRDYTIEAICQRLCISPSRFQHLYKEFFGVSFSDDKINARLEHAKELLLTSDEKISVIGSLCGYNNPEHFIRQFTERIGLSPGGFRKGNTAFLPEKRHEVD